MTGLNSPKANKVTGARRELGGIAVRFGMAGIVNAAFGYMVFAGLVLLGVGRFWALLAAMIAGVAWNFQTASRFVFRDVGRGTIGRFIVVYAAILATNWLSLRLLQNLHVGDLVAQALLTVPLSVLSYLGQKIFVFHSAVNGE